MALPIILADQRLAERRGIKAAIFGKSGIGKTSLLWTLDPQPRCSSISKPATSPSRAGPATRSARARGRSAATSPCSSAGQTRRFVTTSLTARRITRR